MMPLPNPLGFNDAYQPMFPGYTPSIQGMFGGFNNPVMSQLMGVMVPQMMSGVMAQYGLMPFAFSPAQNVYDQMRANRYARQQMEALTAASRDEGTYRQMLLGAASMFGPITPQMRESADVIARDMSGLAPYLMNIDLEAFDAMHGRRGSERAMRFAMFNGLQSARDPLTGRMGISGRGVAEITSRVYERLYESPDVDMRGIGAGQAGRLYDELRQRGLAGRLGAPAGMPEDQAYDVQAGQISDRLKKMSGVVSAMREIFGDAGHPNAPMRELINGLQALTQGGLSSMTPEQMEQSVRTTYNLARNSGMGLQNMVSLMAQGAGVADRLGLDRSAVIGATQGAAAFGSALGSVGRLDMPVFGGFDRDRLTLLDQQLRMQAQASPLANQLSTIVRMADEGRIAEGSEASAIAEAVRNGQTTYNWQGQQKSVYFSAADTMRILQGSGASQFEAVTGLQARYANQEVAVQYGIGDVVRQLQGQTDIRRVVGQSYTSALAGFFRDQGMDPQEALRRAREAAGAVAGDLMGMGADTQRDEAARTEQMAQTIARVTGVDIETARRIEQTGRGMLDERFNTDPALAAYKNFANAHSMFNAETLEEQRRQVAEARAEASLQSAMGGVGSDGPLRRIMDAIMDTGEFTSMGEVLSKALGGVEIDKLKPLFEAAGGKPVFDVWAQQIAAARNAERGEDGKLTAAGETVQARASRIANALRLGGQSATEALADGGLALSDEERRALELAAGGAGLQTMVDQAGLLPGVDESPEARVAALVRQMQEEGGGAVTIAGVRVDAGTTAEARQRVYEAIMQDKYKVGDEEQDVDLGQYEAAAEDIRKAARERDAAAQAQRTITVNLTSGELTLKDETASVTGAGTADNPAGVPAV